MTLCWFKLAMALIADEALWYFTMAVVNERPKLSCSIKHFSKAPSVENSLYKSSFVKSGCRPITLRVRPFYCCTASTFSRGSCLSTGAILLGALLPLTILSLGLSPPRYLWPPLTLSLPSTLPPLPLWGLSYLVCCGLLSSFLMPRCLSGLLNFLVRMSVAWVMG